jgi:carbonic anhydrase
VPPELIFDQGLGDLFVVRIAGNTVTRAGLAAAPIKLENGYCNVIRASPELVVTPYLSCGRQNDSV